MTRVRRARLEDVPALVALMEEFYAEADYPLDRDWAAASCARLLGDESLGAAWIAFHGGPAGYVVLTVRHSMEYGGLDGWVDDLFVRPAFRRHGLARAALEALLAECERRGVLALHVEVGRENDAARPLYERFGLAPREDDRVTLTRRLRQT